MDLGHQDTVCRGEWSPGNRVVYGFLHWLGVECTVGILLVPGNPSKNWNNPIPSS